MSKPYQKIEATANILVIAVALLIIGILAHRHFFSTAPPATPPKSPTLGSRVSLADFDWSKSNKNVLLVLRSGCRFCAESAEFYKKLIEQTKGKNVRVVAVFPQSKEEAEKYLNTLGISGIEIRQTQFSSLDVGGTPTIIVTDDKGEITNVWLGKLSSEKEKEVLARLVG